MVERLRLSRKSGFRLPESAASVARPSRFGNPFKIGDRLPEEYGGDPISDAETAVRLYRKALERTLQGVRRGDEYNPIWEKFGSPDNLRFELETLRGKDLACWCKAGDPCHADVLLEVLAALPAPVTYDPAELYGGLIEHVMKEPPTWLNMI